MSLGSSSSMLNIKRHVNNNTFSMPKILTTQFKSSGITDPVPPQGAIHQSVTIKHPECQSLDPNDLLAPKGVLPQNNSIKPQQGNIAIALTDSLSRRPVVHSQGSNIADLQCFAALNGISNNMEWMGVGVWKVAQDLGDPMRSNHGTIQTAGMTSILNHSDEILPPGQLLYLDNPLIQSIPGDGLRPGVAEPGAAADKFVPSTRCLKWHTERDLAKFIEIRVEDVIKNYMSSRESVELVFDQMYNLVEKELTLNLKFKNNHPQYWYGLCHGISQIGWAFFENENDNIDQTDINFINQLLKQMKTLGTKLQKDADLHNGQRVWDVDFSSNSHPSARVIGEIAGLPEITFDEEDMTVNIQNVKQYLNKIMKRCSCLIVDFYAEIHHFYRTRIIGRTMNYCLPGHQQAIQLGYYHS